MTHKLYFKEKLPRNVNKAARLDCIDFCHATYRSNVTTDDGNKQRPALKIFHFSQLRDFPLKSFATSPVCLSRLQRKSVLCAVRKETFFVVDCTYEQGSLRSFLS